MGAKCTSTVSGYFSPAPVFRTTTRLPDLIQPELRNCLAAASHALPSGQMKTPSSSAIWCCSASRSASATAITMPSVSRTAWSTMKSPGALATVMPNATVRVSDAAGGQRMTSGSFQRSWRSPPGQAPAADQRGRRRHRRADLQADRQAASRPLSEAGEGTALADLENGALVLPTGSHATRLVGHRLPRVVRRAGRTVALVQSALLSRRCDRSGTGAACWLNPGRLLVVCLRNSAVV